MEEIMNKSASEPDINLSNQHEKTPPNFVSQRNKRRREDDSNLEMVGFKEEMKNMLTSMFSTQAKELQKLNATQKEIQNSNHNIEKSIAYLTAQNEEFKKKVEFLEGLMKEDRQYISVLEERIEDLQRGSRKTNFEMKNVPKKSSETKEDLVEMVLNLSNSVGCKIDKNDIKDIYRVRGKKEKIQNTPIIVETSSTLLKTELLKLCKHFNIKHKTKLCAKHLGLRAEEDTPIFITEQLTARGSRLHFLARDLARSRAYKFCWTAYGKVYVRKDENSTIIAIKNEAQVQKLLQQ